MQDFLCDISYCVLFNFSWKLLAAAGGAAAAVFGFPLVIAGLGFAPAGILGGNIAAVLPDEHEKEELVKGLATCLMGPCGGGLSKERAAAVLKEFGRHGINAIGNEAEKIGLQKCLKTIALMASEHRK